MPSWRCNCGIWWPTSPTVRSTERHVLEDTTTLRRLGEVAVRIKYLEVLCQRSISATLHGGDALGSASLAKSVWAELGQELAALAFDVSARSVDTTVVGVSTDVALLDHRGRHDTDQQERHRDAGARTAAPMSARAKWGHLPPEGQEGHG